MSPERDGSRLPRSGGLLVQLRTDADAAAVERLRTGFEEAGLRILIASEGDAAAGPRLAAVGELARLDPDALRADPAVLSLQALLAPLASRALRGRSTRVWLGAPGAQLDRDPGGDLDGDSGVGGAVLVGGERFVVIAGPCAVEGRDQLLGAARAVAAHGAHALRGGAFKPRTSPYAFQGLGREALALLAEARAETGLPVVTEVLEPGEVGAVAEVADCLQVGARNMQNFALLTALGAVDRPVLLKRGLAATLDEVLLAAEYVLAAGNPRVILCERGIRTFEPSTRNTLDLAGVVALKQRTHLPVLVDPSHAAGRRELVAPLAYAAAACGADGLLIEVHPQPACALVDGEQALDPEGFGALMQRLRAFVAAAGRTL